jgi:hypothetical protein
LDNCNGTVSVDAWQDGTVAPGMIELSVVKLEPKKKHGEIRVFFAYGKECK